MQQQLPISTYLLTALIKIALALFVLLTACAYVVLAERKLVARMQNRWGPTRVGPFGFLQPLADGLKFILKEDIIPDHVDKVLFLAAPCIAMGTSLFAFGVVPFGPTTTEIPPQSYQFVIAPRVDVGIVFVFAIGKIGRAHV